MEQTVAVGIGSNLDSPVDQVFRAIDTLAEISQVNFSVSKIYRSLPMGPQDQPDYINAVVMFDTALKPEALLDQLQTIEARQGRTRDGEHWGPRTLDLDLLLFGELEIDSERLKVPHYGITDREFVIQPLLDVAPAVHVPKLGTLNHLLPKKSQLECIACWVDKDY